MKNALNPLYIGAVFLLLSSAILSSTVSYSQANFLKGKVTTRAGDTLVGFIDYQQWSDTPTSILFENPSIREKTFTSSEIRHFEIDEIASYISAEVRYDSSNQKTNYLTSDRQPAFKSARVFLLYVVKSKVSLLSYTEGDRVHFFLQRDDQLEPLINHRYLVWYKDQRIVQENKLFVETLKRSFSDCSSIKIGESYSESSLRTLFVKYNACQQHESKVYEQPKSKISTGIITCVAYDEYKTDFKGGIGYGIGGFTNFNFPNKNYRLSLYSELIYRKTGDQQGLNQDGEFYEVKSIQWSNIFRFRLSPSTPNLTMGAGVCLMGGLKDFIYLPGSTRDPEGEEIQSFINTIIAVELAYRFGNNVIGDLRVESCDPITFEKYPNGDTPSKRYYALRMGIAYKF